MHIEGSGISCGVRRLVISNNDQPTKEQLVELIKTNKNNCAIVMTGVPTRRKDVMMLLLDNGFERIKTPVEYPPDLSVKPSFSAFATIIMHHDHDFDGDDDNSFEKFVETTVSDKLGEMATSIMHHGGYVGNVSFFIRHMAGKE